MKLDWMPLDVPEYLADTGHLSTFEHGAYLLLIMHYWRTGGLPDDDRQLARIAKATPAEWRGVRPVIEPLFKGEGKWKHKRVQEELAKAKKVSATNQEKARDAANARWSKDARGDAPSIDQAMLQNAPSPLPLPSPSKIDILSSEPKCDVHTPPRHGITSTKHGRIYVQKGTSEWDAYADDYRQARGAEPNVNAHGGRWFKTLGEAS